MRPLYDDGTTDPSAVTRDYVLKIDASRNGAREPRAPVLSVFGGKITTYRKLAEAALADLKPFFPHMKPAWTRDAVLPGGDLPQGDRDAWLTELERGHPGLPKDVLRGLAHRHGTRAAAVLGDARKNGDLGDGLRRRSHRAGDRLPAQGGMGGIRGGHPVAAHEVRPTDDAGRARARRAPCR